MPRYEEVASSRFGGWVVRLKLPDDVVIEYKTLRHQTVEEGETLDAIVPFELPFDTTAELNTARIDIRNVQNKAVDRLKRGKAFTFEAGWIPETEENVLSLELVIEDIENLDRGRTRSTVRLLASSLVNKLLLTPLTMVWRPGVVVSQVFQGITDRLGLVAGRNVPGEDYEYRTGMCMWGKALDTYSMLAGDSQSKFYEWNERVFLTPLEKGVDANFTLSPETGLVRSQRLLKRDMRGLMAVGNGEGEPIYRVAALLTPRVFPDAVIQMEDAHDMDPSDMKVRVLRGRFFNDTQKQRVEMVVVPARGTV